MHPNYADRSASLEPSKKPLNVLIKELNGNIEVALKNGCSYKGKMIKVDLFMNILLEGATEYQNEQIMTNWQRAAPRK